MHILALLSTTRSIHSHQAGSGSKCQQLLNSAGSIPGLYHGCVFMMDFVAFFRTTENGDLKHILQLRRLIWPWQAEATFQKRHLWIYTVVFIEACCAPTGSCSPRRPASELQDVAYCIHAGAFKRGSASFENLDNFWHRWRRGRIQQAHPIWRFH